MRYEILGTLRAVDGDKSLSIRPPKMRVVLATLLIRADQVVSVDQLVTEVWGETPPRRATAALYVYVSQLRKLLGGGTDGEGTILTSSPGYVLRTGADALDLQIFQRLVGEGRASIRAGRYEQAGQAFESALALWRGPALNDLRNGPIINGFAIWLEEIRLECTELLVETKLQLGRHRELISFLQTLIREHALHETFYRQLMLALYRSERRADALRVYQAAHTTLRRELGLEPGRQLRELQQSILRSGETLDFKAAV